jgi:hypothetical protein
LPTINEYQKQGITHTENYWKAYNKGLSQYGRGWYEKAKAEFLIIYDNEHGNAYFTHLLRTYRQNAERLVKNKKYEDGLREYVEMFTKCPNVTNTDIRAYNKLIDMMGAIVEKKVLIVETEAPEYICDGAVSFLFEAKKPKGFKIEFDSERLSQYALRNKKQTLTPPLPHVVVEGNSIRYADSSECPKTSRKLYRIKTVSASSSAFMFSTEDLRVYLADWQFNELRQIDATRYVSDKYHLRCVDMAADLSAFLFTVIDECYLMDANFRVRKVWRVPYKIDTSDPKYKRETREGRSSETREGIHAALNSLGITNENPTTDEVKRAFREMTMKYHPDKNKSPDAEERTKEIINAYELIKDANLELVNVAEMEDEYWMEISSRSSFRAHGMEFTFEVGISVDPSDWIYGTGMAKDGSRAYLGCYSGKVYSIGSDGVADVVYAIPSAEPVYEIMECGEYIHISTTSQLYIVHTEQKEFVRAVQLHGSENGGSGYVKHHNCGFIHVLNDDVTFYGCAGEKMGSVRLSKSLKSVCVADGKFVFETANKLYLFG